MVEFVALEKKRWMGLVQSMVVATELFETKCRTHYSLHGTGCDSRCQPQ